jgi:hypothetical protein
MKTLNYLALAAALALAAGCGDDKKPADAGGLSDAAASPDGGSTPGPDAGTVTPDAGTVTPDGGSTMPDGRAATTLVDFVTGLVKNSTTGSAVPETVDDKPLTDTNDPAAFNTLLGL